jgi:hypothetical protein
MSDGCSDCGRKGGCDERKHAMFAAIDEALARLYPTRRWGERDDGAAFRDGVAPDVGPRLAERLARRLNALALFRPGAPDELCDYVYVLCFGRQPSILELREGTAAWVDEEPAGEELYLRVALSAVAPFAAVQQVAMMVERAGEDFVVREAPRAGVFDPILLPRLQGLVAELAEAGVRHLDFGDLTLAPEGFDPGDYPDRYGAQPATVNYLFYPQPAVTVGTTVVRLVASP